MAPLQLPPPPSSGSTAVMFQSDHVTWVLNYWSFDKAWCAVNDRKYVFHFRLKPKPKLEKHLALGRIPKPKVQIYVKIGGILLQFIVSNDLSN